jgi:hypothetical protein
VVSIIKINTSDDHIEIFRYFHWSAFERLIQRQKLVFYTCNKYEDLDFLEGKITSKYRAVLKRAFDLEYSPNEDLSYEEELAHVYARLEAHRQHSYISCWTLNTTEDQRMWQSFASPGVIVKTKVGHVLDRLSEVSASAPKYFLELSSNPFYSDFVSYHRENMHLGLHLSNYEDAIIPIFHLSGEEELNFSHEREYRFVIKDLEGASSEMDQYIMEGVIPNEVKEFEVPFTHDMIAEIIFPPHLEKQVVNLIGSNGPLKNKARTSSL